MSEANRVDVIDSTREILQGAGPLREPRGRPFVTLSYAQSLDGSITARRGQPTAISGSESLTMTHRLRAMHGAILVGVGTILADDPQLSVREIEGESPQPVVLDTRLRTPPDARLFEGEKKAWIFCGPEAPLEAQQALRDKGTVLLQSDVDAQGRLQLRAVLEKLAEKGIDSLMVEGGARVIAGILEARLADLLVLTVAPLFVGGLKAVEGPLGGKDFPRLADPQVQPFGEDLVIWGRLGEAA